jgi:hypothetical protein
MTAGKIYMARLAAPHRRIRTARMERGRLIMGWRSTHRTQAATLNRKMLRLCGTQALDWMP